MITSSENYLVVAGRDKQQNEQLVRRHLNAGVELFKSVSLAHRCTQMTFMSTLTYTVPLVLLCRTMAKEKFLPQHWQRLVTWPFATAQPGTPKLLLMLIGSEPIKWVVSDADLLTFRRSARLHPLVST